MPFLRNHIVFGNGFPRLTAPFVPQSSKRLHSGNIRGVVALAMQRRNHFELKHTPTKVDKPAQFPTMF
jgi:hypothetical protein